MRPFLHGDDLALGFLASGRAVFLGHVPEQRGGERAVFPASPVSQGLPSTWLAAAR
jgi:hypothetical protein